VLHKNNNTNDSGAEKMRVFYKYTSRLAIAAMLLPLPAYSGGYKFSDGDKFLEVGARIQLQYKVDDPATGPKMDDIFFRRLRVRIAGSMHKDWKGQVEWDMGKADGDNEISVKESWMLYSGWNNMTLRIGNSSFPFSREFMTPYTKQQLVERTFVGDLNYGTPDKNVGLHLRGHNSDKILTYRASASIGSVQANDAKLRFNTPVNDLSDHADGYMIGGRVDYHPLGFVKFQQGDFSGKTRFTVGAAAYAWSNDGDMVEDDFSDPAFVSREVDSITALEISAAFRSHGFSIDAQYNNFDSELVDATHTGGLYRNGKTTLNNAAIEGGYMFNNRIELVAGYQTQDADNYATSWNRSSLGANWFIEGNDIKVQLSYRMGENLDGTSGKDKDEIFLQTQFDF
jgi:hypothetical protein